MRGEGGGRSLLCVALCCLCCSLVNLCVFVCFSLSLYWFKLYFLGLVFIMKCICMSFLGGVNGPSFYLNTKIADCAERPSTAEVFL